MDRFVHDWRIALRGLRRTPSFTATAIAILAVGIGMAVAMFSVFDAVIVQRLPVRDQDRIVQLFTYRGDPNADYYLQRENLRQVAAVSRTMRDVAGIAHWAAPETPMLDGDRPLVVNRTLVTGNFFDVIGARPLLGRFIQTADETPGAAPVLVISYGVWQRQFGGDAHIVGHRLIEPYGRKSYEIIGVTPPGLDYPTGVGMWMPAWDPSDKLNVLAVARLAPNATPRAAQAEFLATMNRLFPDRRFAGVNVQTFAQVVAGDARLILVMLAAAVGLLLLIACVNVGNLFLLRATMRARELSIRRALGASLTDLVRQLLVESTVIGVAGGALGLIVAAGLIDMLIAFAPPSLPRMDIIGLSSTPLGIAIGVTLISVLIFGVVPALVGARGQLASPLRFDSRAGSETRVRRRARSVLVASQVALALIMLAGAGLLGRSLERLQGISLGYDADRLSVLTISFPPSLYEDSAHKFDQSRTNAIAEELVPAYRAVPGVTVVTPMLIPPFLGMGVFIGRVDKEGQSPEEMKSNPAVPVEVGGRDFFRVFGIPIRRGRAFTDADNEEAPQVAIVSEAAARRIWPGQDPIGKRIHYWSADSTVLRTVVGVAGDTHWRALRDSAPSVYLPWRQSYWQGSIAIRTSGDLAGVLPALRRATHDVNPLLTLWYAKPMNELLATPLAHPRLAALLLAGFAAVSMLLAAIGLYGVMASAVRAGTRELGVRAALGATPGRLRSGVLVQAMTVAGIGAGVGLLVALSSGRLLSALLFQVSPADPVALLGATAVLLLVAFCAAYIPARRATLIDPVEALRAD